jgi:translocation and assembly module TamB
MTKTAHPIRRIFVRLAKLFGILLLLAFAFILFIGFTAWGNQLAANMIAGMISKPDMTIALEGASGLLAGEFHLDTVRLSDTKGEFLRVEGVQLEWTPTALLSGTFQASQLSVDSVALARLPVKTETAETAPASSTITLPVAVDIATIDLKKIALAKAVAGLQADIGLKGSAKAVQNSISLNLLATDLDRLGAIAKAKLAYGLASKSLTIDADIAEPQGGILATLLKLPGAPPVEISVKGDGPLVNWAGSISAKLDGTEILNVAAHHQLNQAGLHDLTVKGGGSFEKLAPPEFRSLLAGNTQIDIAASFAETGLVNIRSGTITTGSFALTADGKIDPKGQADIRAEIKPTNGTVNFRWPLAKGELAAALRSAALTLNGPFRSAKLTLDADVAALAVPQAQMENIALSAQSDRLDLARKSGTLTLDLKVEDATFADKTIGKIIQGPLEIKTPVTLSAEAISVKGLQLQSPSLGGTLSADFALDTKVLAADAKLFVLPAAILPPELAAKSKGMIAISGKVAGTLPDTFKVSALKIESNLVSIAGDTTYTSGEITAALTGKIPDIALFLPNASGAVNYAVNASGKPDKLDIEARLNAASATLAGRALSGLEVTLKGLYDPKNPKGDLTASGNLDGQKIDITSSLVSTDGKPSIPALDIRIGKNTLTGALEFDPKFLPSGTLKFDFPDIGLLAAMAAQKAEGSLAGTIDLATKDGKIGLAVKANGARLAASGAEIDAPSIDIKSPDILSGQISGTVSAKKITQGANIVSALAADFSLEAGVTGFTVKSTYDGAPLTTKGSVSQTAEGMVIALENFAAAPKKIAVRLKSPAKITISNGTVDLGTLAIITGGGAVTVTGTAGKTLDITAKISALPASLANTFAKDLEAAGQISATVTVKGTPSAPEIAFDTAWSGAQTAQTRNAGLQPLSIAAKGTLLGQRLSLDTTIRNASNLAITAKGTVGISGAKPLALKVSGAVPFSAAAGLLAAQGIALDGAAKLDLSIGGNASAPQISGRISTSGSQFTLIRQNLTLKGLTATVDLKGTQATISGLSADLLTGGSVNVSGTVGFAPGSGFPAALKIALKNAVYTDGNLVAAKLAGDLAVSGRLVDGPAITGTVRVQRADITIPEKIPASLSSIHVTHKNAPGKVSQQKQAIRDDTGAQTKAKGPGINIDLTINAPSQIFVRGRGLDAELGGNVAIKGNSSAPVVSGAFTMVRGRLAILGKRLDFSSGTISFGGGLIPTLNLVATAASSSTSITVTVTGLATNPSFVFTSSPALPQDEVLAQLIFNRSSASLSPVQIAELADAVATLSGGQSSSLFNKLRQGLGVDDLDVGTDENGKAQVSAGKYLTKRTYLQLQQGQDSTTSKATINLDIGKGVKLQGTAGADGTTSTGIFYEKDY